jgi:hypothetical protein
MQTTRPKGAERLPSLERMTICNDLKLAHTAARAAYHSTIATLAGWPLGIPQSHGMPWPEEKLNRKIRSSEGIQPDHLLIFLIFL